MTQQEPITTLHALAEECEAHAQAWDQRHDPEGHGAAWDALHTLLTAAGASVEHLAKLWPNLTPVAVDDIVTAVRQLATHLTVANGDANPPRRRTTTPSPTPAEIQAGAAAVVGRALIDRFDDIWLITPEGVREPGADDHWTREQVERQYGPLREVLLVAQEPTTTEGDHHA